MNTAQLPQTIQWIQDTSFQIVSENYLWPVLVQHPENDEYSIDFPSKGYVLFTNPQNEEFKSNFTESVETLKRTKYWNPRSNFLVLACGKLEESPAEFADTVLTILKKTGNIINAVLIIFTGDTGDNIYNVNTSKTKNISEETITTIYAYSLFPYLNGACNEDIIVLIGKWTVHNASEDSFKSINVFTNKLPKTFTGCVLKILGVGTAPSVFKENYVTKIGEKKFVLRGMGLETANLFAREKNLSLDYLEPVELTSANLFDLAELLMNGGVDLVTGFVPCIHPIYTLADLTHSMAIDTLKYLVPCPKYQSKTHKIMSLFRTSTWLGMLFVFIFVSVLFWTLSHYPTRRNDFTEFNLLAQCFSAAWGVLLGISVPQMPLSLGTRTLFIIYVWYCFAISTVFQAYFTTYLVEPGYEARLETLDDVMRTGLNFTTYQILEGLMGIIDFEELHDFEETKCFDFNECIKDVMFKRETFSLSLSYLSSYLASFSGFHDHSKVVCYLDTPVLTTPMGGALPIGHPLLKIINVHVRRCFEGGLLEDYWSQFLHEVNLKANKTDEDSEFVVFSLTHLSPVFMLLLFGYVLSAILLMCELIIFKTKGSHTRNN
ncbi:hypothetical protein L9F63_003985 [Diploptera punctata]|uniref:Ionotropic glutamate receptor C-terminal domain-containing protein n=1 Tax=Diploptera punctata TaxID=6984 RepID=A0AAD7ZHC1_DIPPU|nr:hypothetical protein L9F63_003985 [Diploptera punctata]